MDTGFVDRLKASMQKVPSSPMAVSPYKSPSSLCSSSPHRHTPSSSRGENYYDRYIPCRAEPNSAARKCLFGSKLRRDTNSEREHSEPPKTEALVYESALRNELLGERITEIPDPHCSPKTLKPFSTLSPSKDNLLHFSSSPCKADIFAPYSTSPVSKSSACMLLSPRRATRRIPKTPFKVLDAPDLQDDYYLNLLDWSAQNVLAVGLGPTVYLWNASTCQVSKLCEVEEDTNTVTSVSWSDRGHYLAVGTNSGAVQIWDPVAVKHINTLSGHSARVGSLSWAGDSLCSGSRDHSILQWDHRLPAFPTRRLLSHVQEVCGLKWSPDHQHLASGGNDNKLYIWSQSSTRPLHCFADHLAAVKAISWSPHQHGLLASGGGTADRHIRFWNTLTGHCLQSTDTGSQVCNLAWSKSSSELISTHGYSQNQIILWHYPSLMHVAKLTGHTSRVLYLSMSPDGQSVVTGAGDETLRFWNVFSKSKSFKEPNSPLDMVSFIR